MITTHHRFIDEFPIAKESRNLIIGTIHPHKVDDFELDFFYGNKNSLWSILAEAFKNQDFSSKQSIIETLQNTSTSITDIIRKCDRENDGITRDSDLFNISLNTEQIREGLENSMISTIYFTSRFGKNNAANLFVREFKIPYRKSWNEAESSFTIGADVFGREIKAVVLFSPSGQANPGISRSKAYLAKRNIFADCPAPVNAFRIKFYTEKFSYLK